MQSNTLPTAKDAEQQVIGSLLIEPALLAETSKVLRPDSFLDPCHRVTFATLNEMYRSGVPIDVISVKGKLECVETFVKLGLSPAVYLAETGGAVASVAHCSYYTGLVAESAIKGRLRDIGSYVSDAASNGKASSEILADLTADLDNLRRESCFSDRFQALTAAELDNGAFDLEWLIDWLLVKGQPCILAGPKKSLKTSQLLALLIALATGNEFLGKFQVKRAVRVVFCSGESGLSTLQETARRIAKAMSWELADVPNFTITTDLPRLNSAEDLAAFATFLEQQETDVVAIDPAYLCMGSDDNGNLFAQGEVLLSVSQLCQRLGVTLILCHHTKRNTGRDAFDQPELEDIAWAGFQEFARQWLLVGRRERYQPGSGVHRLWLSVGGSAGHGGLWAVDIDEGTAESADGRRWHVKVSSAAEAHENAEARKSADKDESKRQQAEADLEAVLKKAASIGSGTKTDIKDAVGINPGRFNTAFATAISEGHLVRTTIKKGNNREYDGYKLTE